jgi:hypothetical protein
MSTMFVGGHDPQFGVSHTSMHGPPSVVDSPPSLSPAVVVSPLVDSLDPPAPSLVSPDSPVSGGSPLDEEPGSDVVIAGSAALPGSAGPLVSAAPLEPSASTTAVDPPLLASPPLDPSCGTVKNHGLLCVQPTPSTNRPSQRTPTSPRYRKHGPAIAATGAATAFAP